MQRRLPDHADLRRRSLAADVLEQQQYAAVDGSAEVLAFMALVDA